MSYPIGIGQDIEIPRTTNDCGRGAINFIGNALANATVGSDGANVISDGSGADILTDRGGADTSVFRTLADRTVNPNKRDTFIDFRQA